ncbi:MAG: hypothetical protein GF383_14725 [Candidatus Lokiarchaeota archaeon]|nr:hypothetical protein [Candidatus Lokiarchaeota archaeon]MBD3342670.1 hypothetical protein [Candidatus Lokiarchaeota archaeon]
MLYMELFGGAKNAFIFFNAYFKTVSDEFGVQKALDLNTKMSEELAAKQGKLMKEKAVTNQFDAKAAFSQLTTIHESLGMGVDPDTQSNFSVIFQIERCPIYEAAKIIGIDPEQFCRSGPLVFLNKVAKELNPNLSYELMKYRKDKDDNCKHQILLK